MDRVARHPNFQTWNKVKHKDFSFLLWDFRLGRRTVSRSSKAAEADGQWIACMSLNMARRFVNVRDSMQFWAPQPHQPRPTPVALKEIAQWTLRVARDPSQIGAERGCGVRRAWSHRSDAGILNFGNYSPVSEARPGGSI